MSFRERIVTLLLPLFTSAVAVAADEPKTMADANGCKFVVPAGMPSDGGMEWDGACVDGFLSGPGTADLGPIFFKGEFAQGRLAHGEMSTFEGHKYTGEFVDNRPRGRGELRFPNGFIVRGQFENPNTISGVAELTWPDGSVYTGEITGLKTMHGKGKLVYADGQVYEGSFLQGRFHGQGRMSQPGGDSYEGEYAHGNYHGHGTLVFSNGARYVGQFVNSERQGEGRLEHPDHAIEEGEWKASRLDGQCHIKYAVGSEYTGQCLNGQLSGQGKFQDATDGSIYEGAFLADKFHGRGRLTRSGYVYEGDFVGGVRSGQGKEVFDSGERYEGTFARGVREGTGVLRAPTANGAELSYEGSFKNGLLHGTGKMKIGPASFDGEFKQGVFSKGRVLDKDGRLLEIDIEQDTVFEIKPDGSKVPFNPDHPPDRKT